MSVPFSIRRMIAGTFVLNVAVIRAIFEVRYKCLAQKLNDRARDLRHVCRSLQINSEGVARHGFLQLEPEIFAAAMFWFGGGRPSLLTRGTCCWGVVAAWIPTPAATC